CTGQVLELSPAVFPRAHDCVSNPYRLACSASALPAQLSCSDQEIDFVPAGVQDIGGLLDREHRKKSQNIAKAAHLDVCQADPDFLAASSLERDPRCHGPQLEDAERAEWSYL